MSMAERANDGVPSLAREIGIAVVGGVVVALVAAGFALGFQISNLHNGLLALSLTAVGLYVVRMRPGDRVGILFVASGVQSALMFFGRQYGLREPQLQGASWLAWLSIWQVPLGMFLAGAVFMVFPTGHLLSRRWRIALAGSAALATVLAVASALWPIEDDWRNTAVSFPFDLGHQSLARDIFWPLMTICYQGFVVLWVVAAVVRIRRAEGDETRQLRWFVTSVVLMAVLLIGGLAVADTPIPGLIATSFIPVAAGVAILKYRLYDIDPVINKTIVAGTMLLLITTGYVAVVLGVGALLPVSAGALTLLTTALVAVVFEPVRRHAQRLADRVVYGYRATPYESLAQLSAQLRKAPDGLLGGLVTAVAHGVGATSVEVWTGERETLRCAAAFPAAEVPGPRALEGLAGIVREIHHGDRFRGALTLRKSGGESLTASERRLLDDLVAQAGLLLEHVQQTADLQAAARRIVTAEDAARRRIERDLHDGAQQRLVTLGLEIGAAVDRAVGAGQHDLATGLRATRAHLLDAIAELRELAQGLHPSLLTQAGLPVALATLADRSPVPVELFVDVPKRLAAEVEATAYFLISEALTNAGRHAGASRVRVYVRSDGCKLSVVVDDDGRGGARRGGGSGLDGLTDRLAALGARLEIISPVGTGTTLRTALPCA